MTNEGKHEMTHPQPVWAAQRLHFNRAETAAILGISTASLDRLVVAGKITPRKIGRRVLYRRDVVQQFAWMNDVPVTMPD